MQFLGTDINNEQTYRKLYRFFKKRLQGLKVNRNPLTVKTYNLTKTFPQIEVINRCNITFHKAQFMDY